MRLTSSRGVSVKRVTRRTTGRGSEKRREGRTAGESGAVCGRLAAMGRIASGAVFDRIESSLPNCVSGGLSGLGLTMLNCKIRAVLSLGGESSEGAETGESRAGRQKGVGRSGQQGETIRSGPVTGQESEDGCRSAEVQIQASARVVFGPAVDATITDLSRGRMAKADGLAVISIVADGQTSSREGHSTVPIWSAKVAENAVAGQVADDC